MFHYSVFLPQTYRFLQSWYHAVLVAFFTPMVTRQSVMQWKPMEIAGIPNISM